MLDDTIAAIATPLGEGGLAVIRISGPQAFEIADRCFSPAGSGAGKLADALSHTLHFGHVQRDNQTLDEVIAAVMRAPRTFTREHVVELTCHGGLLTSKLVLDALLAGGARLAEPGEFSRRAFLNGRIDLTQAEAILDLIQSRTELAVRAANEQLAGKLSQRIHQLRDQLLETLAHIEAHIDFPDEDIAPDTRENLLARLRAGLAFIEELLRRANEGQILRRGIRAAIIGRPNAGKSSLLNQLLGRDRAIVSPIPGTTRDTIEETANIRGLPVIFIDTAGLDQARDEIEAEGMRRSRQSLNQAEFILHVLDASQTLIKADENYLDELAGKKRILVLNKIDLPEAKDFRIASSFVGNASNFESVRASGSLLEKAGDGKEKTLPPVARVSCRTGEGIEPLKDAIRNLIWSGEIKAEMLEVMINSRHQDALSRAAAATSRTIDALANGLTLELAAMDLRIAVNSVGEIVGQTTTEDLLDSIFSQFCIGK